MIEVIIPFTDEAAIRKFERIHGTNGVLTRCRDCRNGTPLTVDRRVFCNLHKSVWAENAYCSGGARREEEG